MICWLDGVGTGVASSVIVPISGTGTLNTGTVISALHDNLTQRDTALDTARQAVGSALRTADRLASGAGRVFAASSHMPDQKM